MAAGGCSEVYRFHKQDADREVYRIIDQKWDQRFGLKANYKVADVNEPAEQVESRPEVHELRVLSLADAVTMATAYNRDYQTQKESLYRVVLALTLERHRFDPQFFGVLSGDVIRDNEEKSRIFGGQFGFDQLLADGARITTSIATDWLRFLSGDPRETLTSVLSATIAQPLLRGAGRRIVQEALTQAERDALYQVRTFNRFRKEFVVSIVADYYRVLQALNAVENAESNYERLKQAKRRLAMFADEGRVPQFEVDQAEQDELRAWDNVVRAQQQYEQLLDRFKIRLSLPTDAPVELDPAELKALETAGVVKVSFNLADAVETALQQRLDLANDADRVDDARRNVYVAANGLWADLNLTADAAVNSPEDFRFGKIEFNQGTYSLGLELGLPLERKAERNAYRDALVALLQRRRAYEQAVDEVKLDVRQAYRELSEAAQRYEIQKQSLELARRRVESTALLLDIGRATTRDLLESQSALLEAENAITEALVNHTIATLRFYRDIGILRVRGDGLWETLESDIENLQAKAGADEVVRTESESGG